ncbi:MULTISPECIES: LeuA family protein [Rhizobium]|uniref:2-isopropylmalate synthase n=1 Tax=Rhizobium aouanii TaxID=3118145 RepID=A0ABU8CKF8_9HYPH|nr:LeuA family protein [Rhizobium acaciae]MCW1410836.1 LeuA family protein [Rhizobium acaciae]MCW1742865.1 LeuA family protein [Rhizobium acaciae]MCW1750061.1 LeuA family protein [Rhizobium acaciae]
MARLIDCTLREGAQAPNVVWRIDQSIAIARGLLEFGVDCIEAGHPSASNLEFDRTRALSQLRRDIPLLAHARAQIEDIRCVKAAGAEWVGIFAGVSEVSRNVKFRNRSLDEIIGLIETSIAFAKSIGLQVRFTLEDTSRTDWNLQGIAYRAAISKGADRICFSDTVGVLTPTEARLSLQRLKSTFSQTPIEVHFHNDRGLALANAVEVAPMVNWISTSVNGIGERCGITDTIAMRANLDFEQTRTLTADQVDLSRKLSDVVSALGRNTIEDRLPIVGRYAFTHCADLHIKAFEKDVNAYCWLKDFDGQNTHRNVAVL